LGAGIQVPAPAIVVALVATDNTGALWLVLAQLAVAQER